MEDREMKTLLTLTFLSLASFAVAAPKTNVFVSCQTTAHIPGSPTYSFVQVVDTDASPPTSSYRIVKTNPSVGPAYKPVSVEIKGTHVIVGGNAWTAMANAGKSGYALFHYNSKSKDLIIDIDLFQPAVRDLNTGTPLTQEKWSCTAPN
jgi:hypothetical protein